MTDSSVFGPRPTKLLHLSENIFSTRIIVAVSLTFFLATAASTVLIAAFKPAFNWDLLPYIAIAAEADTKGAEAAHAFAYGAVELAASEEQFQKLTVSEDYRVRQFETPEFFGSMFPMYKVKFAYVQTLRMLGPAMGWVNAAIVVSAASAGIVALIILLWSSRQGFLQGLLIITPVSLIAGYAATARLATPDLYMTVFSLAAVYFVCRDKPLLSAPFLLLTFLVRPDGIFLMFALLLAALLVAAQRLPYLLIFLACVLLYLPVTAAAEHPGWWAHFYFTNVEIQNDMRGFDPAFDAVLYLKALITNTARTFEDSAWPSLLALFLLGFALLLKAGKVSSRGQWIAFVALVLCLGGKFVTFPIPEDRIYLPYILPLLMVLMEIWKPDFSYEPKNLKTSSAVK